MSKPDTSTMFVHCPHCDAQLDVPAAAAGRPGRCPICKGAFIIPDFHSMLDETVSAWLGHEHDEDDVDRPADASPADADADAAETPPTAELASRRPAEKVDAPQRPGEDRSSAPTEPTPTASSSPPPKPASPPPASKPPVARDATPEEPAIKITSKGKAVYTVRSAIKRQRPPAVGEAITPQHPAPPSSPESRRDDDRPTARPARRAAANPPNTAYDREAVVLHVLDVTAAGVLIGFGSHLLMRPRFRASLPMCCILTGSEDKHNLIARPLAWVDKAGGKFSNPGEIEAAYEYHVKAHQTPREVADQMRTIDELPAPFNLAMPYYVSTEMSSHVSVHCHTISTPDGVHCEVLIPAAPYALKWLGRVNGVCGEDYERLEQQVLKFEDASWREIPEQVRKRIAGWFDFEPGEHFVGYISDSDFTKKDAGLAGLIITDQRVVYCKYHNHGAFRINDENTWVIAVADGPFFDIIYQHDRTRKKIVRLRRDDCEQLGQLLSDVGSTLHIEAAR